MTHIMRINGMRMPLNGVSFPIDAINKDEEKIHIEKKGYDGKLLYTLNVNNGQFNYVTSDFGNCLNFARLTIDEVK